MIIYRQSDIPEDFRACSGYLSNFITVSQLSLGHAYKASKEEGSPVSSLLMYPVLMASDIFAIDADEVIVGIDQLQHLEITRDIGRKIHSTYNKDVLKIPKEVIMNKELLKGIDGRKMSKSYNNTIPLFADKDEISKRIYKIETDSKSKGRAT